MATHRDDYHAHWQEVNVAIDTHDIHDTTFMSPLETPPISVAAPITAQDLQVIHLVGMASHKMLLESGNPHYSRLYLENVMLRARLQTHGITSFTLNHLQAKLSELEGKFFAPAPAHKTSEKVPILSPPSIPAPSPPLERKDFPNVRFWTMKEWNAYKRRGSETIGKLGFLTTCSGEPVSTEYLEHMSVTARRLFNELHIRGLAPPTWKAKSRTASDYFINTMVLEFPELRWCEGGRWKAEAFAVTRYPDCSRKFCDTDNHTSAEHARTKKRKKSSRPSQQKQPLSPDGDLPNGDVSNDNNKELFESGNSSASCLSMLSRVVSDSSFPLLCAGALGLPPPNIVQPDLPSSPENQNDTIASGEALQASIISNVTLSELVMMLQSSLSSPTSSHILHCNDWQTDNANANETHGSRSLTNSFSPT